MMAMGIINLSIDDETKYKLEKIVKQKGYSDINTFIAEIIKKELNLELPIVQEEGYKQILDDNEVIEQLSNFSEKLSEMSSQDEKVRILIEFDEFLKQNKEVIKNKYPNFIVSILNSL